MEGGHGVGLALSVGPVQSMSMYCEVTCLHADTCIKRLCAVHDCIMQHDNPDLQCMVFTTSCYALASQSHRTNDGWVCARSVSSGHGNKDERYQDNRESLLVSADGELWASDALRPFD